MVRRHVNLVYSAALRRCAGDAHLAQDVAQSVFTDLARKAGSLAGRESLTGWLYTSAHFASAKIVRAESRRREREEQFMRQPASQPAPEMDWEKIRPVLDDVMHELKAADREAILLRFFENRPFAEVGAKLGLNENAARMRVDRALEKLRSVLARRGIATTGALASVVSANAVQLAPASLAATLATASITASQTGATLAILKLMTATKLTLGLTALVALGATTALVVQHQVQKRTQAENEALRQEVTQLKTDNEGLANRPAPAAQSQPPPDGQSTELLRLRGEVGVLRRQTNELASLLANARKGQSRGPNAPAERQPWTLTEDYPKTPDGATRGIFEAWARGDWDGFFTNYAEPGVPRELYDRMFTDEMKSNYLAGLEIVSVGQPTNSFGSNMWFVPYKLRFKDGSEKEFRLHVAQDPSSQRWFFKGGF